MTVEKQRGCFELKDLEMFSPLSAGTFHSLLAVSVQLLRSDSILFNIPRVHQRAETMSQPKRKWHLYTERAWTGWQSPETSDHIPPAPQIIWTASRTDAVEDWTLTNTNHQHPDPGEAPGPYRVRGCTAQLRGELDALLHSHVHIVWQGSRTFYTLQFDLITHQSGSCLDKRLFFRAVNQRQHCDLMFTAGRVMLSSRRGIDKRTWVNHK